MKCTPSLEYNLANIYQYFNTHTLDPGHPFHKSILVDRGFVEKGAKEEEFDAKSASSAPLISLGIPQRSEAQTGQPYRLPL